MTTDKYHNGYDPQIGDHVIDPGSFRGRITSLEGNEARVEYSDGTHEWYAVWDLDLASDGLALRANKAIAADPRTLNASGFDLWKQMRKQEGLE